MGKDGFLTPKAIANRIKAKGLQKLKWYCQACEKQCRDENGYKCHMTSESHLRQLLLIAETPDTYLDNYSQEFKSEFIKLLSRRYNTKRVLANQVYQEFIADRHHLHMNATHWDTLTDFVKHLGREGICHVDETPKGWFITWIDNSPKALERQAANQKRERQDMDDEQREQRMIQEQIERARLESSGSGLNSSGESSPEASELIRQDEKIKLNLSLKPVAAPAAAATATAVKPKPLAAIAMAKVGSGKKLSGLAALASKERPLDTGASAVGRALSTPAQKEGKRKLTAMEEIMMREQEKKKRKESTNGIDRLGGGLNTNVHRREAWKPEVGRAMTEAGRARVGERERGSRWGDGGRDVGRERERSTSWEREKERKRLRSRSPDMDRKRSRSRERERERYRRRSRSPLRERS